MKIKYSAIGVVVSLVLLAAAVPSQAAERLNFLCSAQNDWCQLMANTFERKTGVDVSMVRKSTGESLAQIRAERNNPKIDIWWGGTGDPHLQAAQENLTTPYKSSKLNELLGWARNLWDISNGRTVGIYAGALGIGYNAELLERNDLKIPLCWADLADPAYKNEIQIANPNSSGTAYTALATLVQLFGETKAFALLKAIGKNVNQYTKSGSAPIKAAARKETTLAITFQHDMVKQAVAGFPIKIISPCEGTGYEIGAVSIIKGARNLTNAQKFVDFALTADVQSLAAVKVKAFQVPSNSKARVSDKSPDLKSIKLIDYDFKTFGSSEMRRHLLSRWNKEVKR